MKKEESSTQEQQKRKGQARHNPAGSSQNVKCTQSCEAGACRSWGGGERAEGRGAVPEDTTAAAGPAEGGRELSSAFTEAATWRRHDLLPGLCAHKSQSLLWRAPDFFYCKFTGI